MDLAYMLVMACEEVLEAGEIPENDAAVAIISDRIGFASPVGSMSLSEWKRLVTLCAQRAVARLEVNHDKLN